MTSPITISRKTWLWSISLLGWLAACGQPPQYRPEARNTQTAPAQGASGKSNDNSGKSMDASSSKQTMPSSGSTGTNTASTQTPSTEPPAPKPPTADPSLGIVATGKTLVIQNCATNCHKGNAIDAKKPDDLVKGNSITAHPANLKTMNFFTVAEKGTPANNASHVLAFLMSVSTPVTGPIAP